MSKFFFCVCICGCVFMRTCESAGQQITKKGASDSLSNFHSQNKDWGNLGLIWPSCMSACERPAIGMQGMVHPQQ